MGVLAAAFGAFGAFGCVVTSLAGASTVGATPATSGPESAPVVAELASPPTIDLDTLAGVILGEIEGRLGRHLSVPWTLKWAEPGLLSLSREASTSGAVDAAGKLLTCVTRLGPAARLLDEFELMSLAASSVFSCFQQDLLGHDRAAALPRWIKFGERAWVGETVSGGTSLSTTWWDGWLGQPIVPLSARAYDAIGWFASVEASTESTWALLDPLMSDPASYSGIDHKALEEWATRLVRRADLSTWESSGPGITATRATPAEVAIAVGSSHRFDVNPDTVQLAKLSTEGDVLHLAINGPIGGGLAGAATAAPLTLGMTSGDFCLRPDGCLCPDGAPPPGPAFTAIGSTAVTLAIVAVGAAGKVEATPVKLDTLCPVPPPTAAPTSGIVGHWVSTGWTMPPAVFGTVTGGAGIVMDIGADGSIAVNWDGMTPVVAEQDISGTSVQTVTSITGTMSGRIPVMSDTSLIAEYDVNDVVVTVGVTVDGVATPEFSITADEAAASYGLTLPMTNATVSIEGTHLTLSQEIPSGLGTIAIQFER